MSNLDLYLSDISNTLKNLEVNGTDVDGIESELAELNDSIQNLNDDLNERLDNLIEVIKNAK